MKEGVVLYFKTRWTIIVTQVDFRFLPITNLFVAFITSFLANQNVMSCARGDLTFHFRDEAVAGLSLWNLNLH